MSGLLTTGILQQASNLSGIIPTNGLIAEYLFENNINDTSGNGNNLSYLDTNTFSFVEGLNSEVNSAVKSGYANINNPLINHSNDFSVSCWINKRNGNITNERVWSFSSNNTNKGVISLYGSSDGLIFNTIDDLGNLLNLITNIDTPIEDKWYNLVLIRSSDILYSYVDSVLIDQVPAGNYTNVRFTVGLFYRNGSQLLQEIVDCVVDNIRIYNRALTTEEITQLYNE